MIVECLATKNQKKGSELTTFILVRHGTTDWVDQHILHGITDIPLNENGLQQAHLAARALEGIKAQSLYSSPLIRCMQTADILSEKLGPQPVALDGLKELDFGWWEGKPFRDHSMQDYGPINRFIDKYFRQLIRSLTGESRRNFQKRVFAAWDRMLSDNPHGTVVVVGHSAVFNTILIKYFGRNFPKGKSYYIMHPGSIIEMVIEPNGRSRLVRMNDVAHQN